MGFLSAHRRRPAKPARRPSFHRPRLEALEDRCVPSAGQLDPTFGSGGIVTTSIGTKAAGQATVLQPDGKILVAGEGNGNQFALVRYTPSGSLDTTFGSGGEVTSNLSNGGDAFALALYPIAGTANDGKIVVAGQSGAPGGSGPLTLMRYNPNGTPDTSFGTKGVVTTAIGSYGAGANAVVIQADGKIVVGGYSNLSQATGGQDAALARYNVNGTLDTTFGNGGEIVTNFGNLAAQINALVLQADGKIVAGGYVTNGVINHALNEEMTVARYNSNGTLDPTFGSAHNGIAYTPQGTRTADRADAVVLQPDGKIVAAGALVDETDNPVGPHAEFAVARFNPDGTIDSSFANGGEATLYINRTPVYLLNDEAYAVALQPNGKIVLAGGHDTGSTQNPASIALARFNSDGSLDTSFNGTGFVVTPMSTKMVAYGAAVQPADGKIVVASGPPLDVGSGAMTVLRYQGDTTTFAVTGYPSPSTAGVAASFTVTALDFQGNLQTSYTGTVHFTSSDPQAVLPPDYTFTAADQGVHTFTATLETAGSQSITATDAANDFVGFQKGITITPAAVSTLSLAGYSSPTNVGIPGTFTVTALDPYGNVATSYAGTIQFSSSDGSAALPAAYTFTAADAGVHTFSATLNTVGTQSLTATDTATPSLTSTQGNITVNPAGLPAVSFSASGFPSPTTAGVAETITVTARDVNGAVAPSYRGTVHFTSSDAQAVLPADYTFTGADQGVHSFTITLKTAGSQSITATDTVTSSITGKETGITITAAAAVQFVMTGPSTVQHGVAFSLTLTLYDAYGNVATGYRGTVHFTTGYKATLPADYTFTAADAGVHTFTSAFVLRTKGTQLIDVVDLANSVPGDSDILTVT